MAQHANYWSCSKFADWIRGTRKPVCETMEGWDEWDDVAKAKHPYRFWVSDTALDAIQDFVTWPTRKLYDIKYYINNRWVSKAHACTAHKNDVKPGEWCDVGHRFLFCVFNELVDFVEIELAWSNIMWDDKAAKKYKSPWYARGWFRWRVWRSKESGIDNLKWQQSLTCEDSDEPTPQAIAAKEIYDLYQWWTFTRKERPDIYDATGWTDYCESKRGEGGRRWMGDPDEKSKEILDKMHELEAKYEQEDEDMLIRLIKVRNSLWT